MIEGANAQSWSYDSMGRVTGQHRHTNGVEKNASYAYDYNGNITRITYPSGQNVDFVNDSANRPSTAQNDGATFYYIQGNCSNGLGSNGVCYAPQGSVSGATLGPAGSTALSLAASYNPRLQPNQIKYSNTGGTVWGLQYSFVDGSGHNNGDPMGITNLVDSSRSQQFAYDQIDRVVTAGTTSGYPNVRCWGERYTYDQWSNLTSIGVANSGYTGCTQDALSVVANASNQISGLGYDAIGNVLSDGVHSYTFDAENRTKTAAGISYTYDGDGNRVQKSGGTIYWYGLKSEVLDESDLSGNITAEYVYFGGQRIAWNQGNSFINYYIADTLGTASGVFNYEGSLCFNADVTPWGSERVIPDNICPQNSFYFFTGKERDSESSLDYFGARSYSSRLARFMSPDSLNLTDEGITAPGSRLNKYSYGANNPLKYVDPDGKDVTFFYDQGGIAGHAVLYAYNPSNGQSAIESFGPRTHAPVWAGESQFDMNSMTTLDDLKRTYSALTIQTTPEVAQAVID
jgi:RHS repeat-associated protein